MEASFTRGACQNMAPFIYVHSITVVSKWVASDVSCGCAADLMAATISGSSTILPALTTWPRYLSSYSGHIRVQDG